MKITINDRDVNIGTEATEQEKRGWLEDAKLALQKAFPGAEVCLGATDSMNSVLRIEDDNGEILDHSAYDYQYAIEVLNRMW